MSFRNSRPAPECCFLLVFFLIPYAEAFTFTKQPDNLTFVVEGVNSTGVPLVWEFRLQSFESITNISIWRSLPGQVPTTIAWRFENTTFSLKEAGFATKYRALLPATLQLLNVNEDEEYRYSLQVTFVQSDITKQVTSRTQIVVLVPPKITKVPARNSRVNAGRDLTLTCNASGDPVPNITWSREGATTNQLVNATGYKLTLVNVQRQDVGSYRCTANNGYGTASSLAIVNVICSQCETRTVGITITAVAWWKDSLRNPVSIEYKMLASNLTSAIVATYSRPENQGKQLHEVAIEYFREGSVFAVVQMQFPRGISDPLQPLQSEMNDGRLGIFTVNRELIVNPTTPAATSASTTKASGGTAVTGMSAFTGGYILLVIFVALCSILP